MITFIQNVRWSFVCLAVVGCVLTPALGQAQTQNRIIKIGTGGVSGEYFPMGRAICNAVNKRAAEVGFHCSAISSGGSVENASKVRTGKYDFGIVQSDVQFYATKGYGPFKKAGADRNLRAVLSFYPETFTVVARADAGIRALKDLKGKRVNIGNPGSGQRTSTDLVMHFEGWSKKDFAQTSQLTSTEQSAALCSNKIDAFVFTAGHPNAAINEAAKACPIVLVSVRDAAIKKLVNKYPYYNPVVIPGETYLGTGWSTPTFGVLSTLVTSKDTPDKVVTEVVKSIFRDFTDFKFSHPAFFNLDPEQMIKKGQTAPYHPGALRYFRLTGFMPNVDKVKPAPKR
ncbi:MAG: TAXI family TRAP transporter solute-binding subunit [Magnetovibrio sp.]|nr:TAXI family TRAP transporter solute-binding subunit [Magnetovibrio sp.]